MRVFLAVDVPLDLRQVRNLPVSMVLDVAAALRDAGYPAFANGQLMGFELDLDSLVLVEVDIDGQPFNAGKAEGLLWAPTGGSVPFDAKTNPVLSLDWVLSGTAGPQRSFFLYFDSLHHGSKPRVSAAAEQASAVSTAVGPGRGTTLFVPLHGDLGLQSTQDPRAIRVTNLQDRAVTVDLYRYTRLGTPEPQPWRAAVPVPAGAGQTVELRLDPSDSAGALKLVSHGGPVIAEASSRLTAATYQAGSSRLFLPSADGGFIGSTFAGASPVASDWLVFCPKVPVNVGSCQVSFTGTPTTATVSVAGFQRLSAAPNVPHRLTVSTGLVAVQRVPSGAAATREQFGVAPWPAMDGPSQSLFNGDSRSDQADRRDKLVLATAGAASRLEVRGLVGQRTVLAEGLEPGGPGIFTESIGGAWGTTWARAWRPPEGQPAPDHEDGPARITDLAKAGLMVLNGYVRGDSEFSALVPLQSPDGGLSYRASVPTNLAGQPLGRIALFAPYGGTFVSAIDPQGETLPTRPALLQDQFIPDFVDKAGTWSITATRPVVAFWVKVGADPMAGMASGITQGARASVAGAQFAGHAFEISVEGGFQPVQPGTTATFRLQIKNAARTTDGLPLADNVKVTATTPSGWDPADVAPSTVVLAPDRTAAATVVVRVPTQIDLDQGGATILVDAVSSGDPQYHLQLSLRIKYEVARGVDVTADGLDSLVERDVAAGEAATFQMQLTNRGSVPDSFRLEHSGGTARWRVEAFCIQAPTCFEDDQHTTPTLAAGASLDYVIEVTPLAPEAGRLTLAFVASSESDPTVTDVVRVSTSVDVDRQLAVLVEDATRVVAPGQSTTFDVVLRNDGARDEEVHVAVLSAAPAGWGNATAAVQIPGVEQTVPLGAVNGTIGIPSGTSARVLVTQSVPIGEAPNRLAVLRLKIQSSLGAQDSSERELRVVSGRIFGLDPTWPAGPLALQPGGTMEIPIQMRSVSNTNVTVTVTAAIQAADPSWAVKQAGNQGPWTLVLSPNSNTTVRLEVTAPAFATPTSAAPTDLTVRLALPGAPVLVRHIALLVPDVVGVTVLDDRLTVEAGRQQPVSLRVRNDGNLPVTVQAAFTALDWASNWRPAAIQPGETAALGGVVQVPRAAIGRTVEILLEDAAGRHLASKAVVVTVARGHLAVDLSSSSLLGDGLRVFRFEVMNTGNESARAVHLELRSGSTVLDTVDIATILPGSSHVANLVGPSKGQLSLSMQTAGDPAGATMDVQKDSAGDAQGIPAAPWLAAVGLAIALWGWRRNR